MPNISGGCVFKAKNYYRDLNGDRFDLYILSATKQEAIIGKKFGIFPIKQWGWLIHAIAIDPESSWSAGQIKTFLSLTEANKYKDVTDKYQELFSAVLAEAIPQKPESDGHWH